MQRLSISIFSLVALAGSAGAQPAPDPQPAPPAEPAPAQPEPTAPPAGPPAPVAVAPPPSPAQSEKPPAPSVSGKWTTSFYGFAQGDLIHDSTQGRSEALGNAALPRPANGTTPSTYAAAHGQFITTARNSRLGFRFSAPTVNDIKPTGNIEIDLNGNQPPGISEASTYVNATMRIRHAYLRFETPVVDVLLGQTWQLFGWQAMAQPGTIQFQGLPGVLSSRTPQLRISKTIKAGDVSVEAAIAATRPAQRNSGLPDGVGGLKLSYTKLKAHRIVGGSGSADDPAAIGVSVIGRRFNVTEFKMTPVDSVQKNGYGLAVDAILPIIPATKDSHANALTLEGEFVTGGAIADLYTGLSGGVGQAPLMPGGTAFAPDVDNGLVEFVADGTLHPVRWQAFNVIGQYFLPPNGNIAITVDYSHLSSDNAHAFGAANRVFDKQDYVDGTLFFDITPAVRLGAGFAWNRQTYVDGVEASDVRGQFSGLFIF